MLGHDSKRRGFSVFATVCAALLLPACGDEPVEPDETPPDLTGSYTLVSFTSTFTAGDTLTPPAADGSFSLVQTDVVGQEATGTLDLHIEFPSETGPGTTLDFVGGYRNRFNGTWEQESAEGLQASGMYSLEGNILSVAVTEPAIFISATVWRRQ